LILPDVNVLIYAFRRDVPEHAVCRPWLDKVIAGNTRFGISPLTLSALVRIVTNRRIHANPSPIDEALAFCGNLLNQPHCQAIAPGDRHWSIFKRLCIDTNIAGPVVADAWYAALAIEWGCEWVTLDRDFARFPGLRVSSPG
jgi:uncharacterized protein